MALHSKNSDQHGGTPDGPFGPVVTIKQAAGAEYSKAYTDTLQTDVNPESDPGAPLTAVTIEG